MTLSPLTDAPADPPDEQLVTLAQGGDRRALEQLVARHGEVVVAAAYRVAERVLDAGAWQALTSSLEATGASLFRGATEPEALRA